MLQVKVKIRENKYKNKDGQEVINQEIKFNDLGVDQYIVVKKLYNECKTFSGKRKEDGVEFVINKTQVEYNGEKVSVNLSPKSVEKWNSLPLGDVNVCKREVTSNGNTYNVYEYTTGKVEEELDSNSLPF
jgi:hypothetical protein